MNWPTCTYRHCNNAGRYDSGYCGIHDITFNDGAGARLERPMRPNWDSYFLEIATIVAKRATCDRKHVGAVIVDERKRIVSTGYNGAPAGMPHCDDAGHEMKEIEGRMSCVRTLHAESNALDDAGRRARGGSLYVTVVPCYPCAQRIVNAGIVKVVYGGWYESQNTKLVGEFFDKAGVVFPRELGEDVFGSRDIDDGRGHL